MSNSIVITTAPKVTTGYLTLASVDSIDQDQFKASDLKAVTELWDAVFIQNAVSEEIYDAISAYSGKSQARKDAVSRTFDFMFTYCLYLISDKHALYEFILD